MQENGEAGLHREVKPIAKEYSQVPRATSETNRQIATNERESLAFAITHECCANRNH